MQTADLNQATKEHVLYLDSLGLRVPTSVQGPLSQFLYQPKDITPRVPGLKDLVLQEYSTFDKFYDEGIENLGGTFGRSIFFVQFALNRQKIIKFDHFPIKNILDWLKKSIRLILINYKLDQ